ncbi:hypothetical protein SAMN05421780_102475 [Flexibacter flexilis DSM 6793]|uniref:Uncharacterized protein n=2 Tax=Flexibacter flexilis TaxID=998 RepID=A0A1I1G6G5_9BACT|nr:hypothetical protein SAMN05421780_102475 [Flexibacter flexilis DSM 6793]
MAFVFLCQCSPKETITDEKYKTLSEYFSQKHDVRISPAIKRIFVLTEKECVGCNARFSRLISSNINDTSSIVLVAASGTAVDISIFTDQPTQNVYFDEEAPETNPLFAHTQAIFLKNQAVDTIVAIKAAELQQQFDFIKNRK